MADPNKQTRPTSSLLFGYGFGPLEKRLYEFLRSAARKPVAYAKDRWEVVKHVWGPAADGRKRRSYFVCLRQLAYAVNRKLRAAGNPRRVLSPHPTFLALLEPTDPRARPDPKRFRDRLRSWGLLEPTDPRPAPVAPESGARRRTSPRRHLPRPSLSECKDLLWQALADGINRSADLERLCLVERRCSRRVYFQARSDLGLQPVRRKDGDKWFWGVTLSDPPHLTAPK